MSFNYSKIINHFNNKNNLDKFKILLKNYNSNKNYNNNMNKKSNNKKSNNKKTNNKTCELVFEKDLFIKEDKINKNLCYAYSKVPKKDEYCQCRSKPLIINGETLQLCREHYKEVEDNAEYRCPKFGLVNYPRPNINFKTKKQIKYTDWLGNAEKVEENPYYVQDYCNELYCPLIEIDKLNKEQKKIKAEQKEKEKEEAKKLREENKKKQEEEKKKANEPPIIDNYNILDEYWDYSKLPYYDIEITYDTDDENDYSELFKESNIVKVALQGVVYYLKNTEKIDVINVTDDLVGYFNKETGEIDFNKDYIEIHNCNILDKKMTDIIYVD